LGKLNVNTQLLLQPANRNAGGQHVGEVPTSVPLGMVLSSIWENLGIIPLKSAPCGGSEPPSNTQFLGPSPAHIQNTISIGSAFLHGSRSLPTNRPHYSTCSNSPHLASSVMRPNNNDDDHHHHNNNKQ